MTDLTREQIEALLANDPDVLGKIARDALRTALSLYQRVEDAEAAQALTVERVETLTREVISLEALCDHDCDNEDCVRCFHYPEILEQKKSAIRALAPDTGKAALAALRAERDELRERVKRLSFMGEGYVFLERERDTLAASLAAAQAEVTGMEEALQDPLVVHLNMVAGKIAKPLPSQLVHIYGEESVRAALAAHDSRNDKEGG